MKTSYDCLSVLTNWFKIKIKYHSQTPKCLVIQNCLSLNVWVLGILIDLIQFVKTQKQTFLQGFIVSMVSKIDWFSFNIICNF